MTKSDRIHSMSAKASPATFAAVSSSSRRRVASRSNCLIRVIEIFSLLSPVWALLFRRFLPLQKCLKDRAQTLKYTHSLSGIIAILGVVLGQILEVIDHFRFFRRV